ETPEARKQDETDERSADAAAEAYPSIGDWAQCSADPQYRAAVVDLLGALAYGELSAFQRLAEGPKRAPRLEGKAALAGMAAGAAGHYRVLSERLAGIGESPAEAMQPFAEALESFHRMTAPADWEEGLVKAYVGDSIAADFYREVAVRLDDDTR